MKKVLILTILFSTVVFAARAQDDPEYKAELGVGLGLVSYHGDLGGGILSNVKPLYSVVARYRFNPRIGLALYAGYGTISGSSENTDTWYPDIDGKTIEFSNSLIDASLRLEYNFWPYGTGREYRGAKPLSPYIAIGLGFSHSDTPKGGVFTTQMPIGAGVKYKVSARLNLSLEWTMHFTSSDKLENVDDPYNIESSGIFKNTDCYSVLQLAVTYDVWAKCKVCNNDRF